MFRAERRPMLTPFNAQTNALKYNAIKHHPPHPKPLPSRFDSLEQKRKPLIRSDGAKEWVPLSGIVAQSL